MKDIVLLCLLFNVIYCTSQTHFESQPFIRENVLDRGYEEAKFLYQHGNTGYYWVKAKEKKRAYLGFRYSMSLPNVVVVHDIRTDQPILELVQYQENKQEERRSFIPQNSASDEVVFKALLPNFPNARLVYMLHYVKGVYLENVYKNPDGIENPIVEARYNNFNGKIQGQSITMGYGKNRQFSDRNSVDDALSIRKRISKNEIKTINTKPDQNEIAARKKALEEKDKAKLAANRINPSNTILRLDKSPKGRRNEAGNALFGKEYNDKLNQLFDEMSESLDQSPDIKVIDSEQYFKNIFYGHFSELKPELVSKSLFGSKDYFPDFHNAFLFYANREFGNDYSPNMRSKKFDIVTTNTTKDGFGNVISSYDSTTPYELFLPQAFLPKFNQYLNKNQFSWSGEQFNIEFERLILSFLYQHKPDSLAFKQMMQNVYRYSKGMDPVSKKEALGWVFP